MISVYTEGDRCKKCYSCVRSCPTKAIQVHGGQADILEEYCISCGHCVATCSQGAKMVESAVDRVLAFLENAGKPGAADHDTEVPVFAVEGGAPKERHPPKRKLDSSNRVFAIVAPSFPAAFLGVEPERLVGAIRRLGFSGVFEVAFGADLVSYEYYKRYRKLLTEEEGSFIISTPCPSIVSYVEKIFPELTPYLARIVSPMEAMARVIRETVDADGRAGRAGCRIVFIGPCAAKKDEARELGTVDAVLTFSELGELFLKKSLKPADAPPSRTSTRPTRTSARSTPSRGGFSRPPASARTSSRAPSTLWKDRSA